MTVQAHRFGLYLEGCGPEGELRAAHLGVERRERDTMSVEFAGLVSRGRSRGSILAVLGKPLSDEHRFSRYNLSVRQGYLFEFRWSTSGEVLEPTYLQLNAQQFRVAAEWEHFAVLSLLQCSDFRSEIEWIARRLGITEARASQVVSRLLELGLLAADAEGKLSRSEKNYRTPDDTADVSLKKCHEQSLELARESLYRDSVDERDFTSVTVAVNPKNLRTAKEMIRKFQDELCDRLEDGTRTEVYRLSVQLFPLSTLSAKAERKSL